MKRQTKSIVAPPWPHQIQTTEFFRSRPLGNDFGDPGIGKTRSQLDRYAQRASPGRLLVLCPKTLMQSAWGNDIESWQPGITYSMAYAENREEAFKIKTDAVICNLDGVKDLAKNPRWLKDFDDIVIDESTAYKHSTSDRSKAARQVVKSFKHRHAMTGTPNPISVTELWHQMMLIDDGKRLGQSYYKLRSVMQVPTQIGPMPNHLRWDDKPGAAQAVDELLQDITIRFAFDEVMQHVPKQTPPEFKRFALNRKTKAIYDRMEADAVIALKDNFVTAVHAAALRTKLLQIASGAVYTGDDNYAVIDTSRYELICDLIEEREHAVVFFNWKHQRDQLLKMMTARKLPHTLIDGSVKQTDRDIRVAEFQEGKYRAMFLHPRTGAHGLTLTAAETTIISSPIYEADLLKQAIHRIYRGGQTKRTNTILVEADGTVERAVYERLFEKKERMEDLLQLISARKK